MVHAMYMYKLIRLLKFLAEGTEHKQDGWLKYSGNTQNNFLTSGVLKIVRWV